MNREAAVKIFQVLAFVLLVAFIATPSYGQMGYQTMYSDASTLSGGDSYNLASPTQGVLVGIGVTEDSYNSYGHSYSVTTTVYPPTGGQYSFTSGGGSYVQAYVHAPITGSEQVGTYFNVGAEHYYECPYSPGSTIFAGSTGMAPIEVLAVQNTRYFLTTYSTAQFGQTTCYYDICSSSLPHICNKTNFTTLRNVYGDGPCTSHIKMWWVKLKIGFISHCARSIPFPETSCG